MEYLSTQGYEAQWSEADDGDGFILQTSNCPFEKVATDHDDVCQLDMYLISNLLGVVPRRLGRIAEGEHSCDYFIPNIERTVLRIITKLYFIVIFNQYFLINLQMMVYKPF